MTRVLIAALMLAPSLSALAAEKFCIDLRYTQESRYIDPINNFVIERREVVDLALQQRRVDVSEFNPNASPIRYSEWYFPTQRRGVRVTSDGRCTEFAYLTPLPRLCFDNGALTGESFAPSPGQLALRANLPSPPNQSIQFGFETQATNDTSCNPAPGQSCFRIYPIESVAIATEPTAFGPYQWHTRWSNFRSNVAPRAEFGLPRSCRRLPPAP